MIGIAVVGYGYWGPNLARNAALTKGAKLVAVCDKRPDRLEVAKSLHPYAEVSDDFAAVLAMPEVDAVMVATPVSHHFSLAKLALEAGKHVLVEKPITLNAEEARALIALAKAKDLILMVDHTFVYTGAVRKIRSLVDDGTLGKILYYDSTRINLGLFQHDVDVFWDLAVHDLAVMDYVLPQKPIAVSATGSAHVPGAPANIAYLTLFFEDETIAHINVNWLAPVKLRRTLIGGSQKMIVFDDLEPSEKLKIYDKGITVDDTYASRIGYRSGDMYAPKVDGDEALRVEHAHFVECIINHTQPETPGEAGLRVVEILEAASRSMAARGNVIDLAKPATL